MYTVKGNDLIQGEKVIETFGSHSEAVAAAEALRKPKKGSGKESASTTTNPRSATSK